jgi:glycosyltransferase involved in cell wall biosynthesis
MVIYSFYLNNSKYLYKQIDMNKKIKMSVVIPSFNEENNIKLLYSKLKPVLISSKFDYEIIFINDGSTDKTLDKLLEINKGDKNLKIISFRRNFGQTAALAAGFDHALGDVIVTMDADLQNDPKDIPRLLVKLFKGYDIVSGWRKNRKDPFFSRILPSYIANWMISILSGVYLHDYGCTLKAYKKEVVKNIKLYGEMHRFIPAIASAQGAKITEVIVSHHKRRHGKGNYGLWRAPKVFLDLLFVKYLLSFSIKPLHFFGFIGTILFLFGGTMSLVLFYERMFLGKPMSDRPLFVVSIFLLLASIQLITFGILAEVLTRIYFESQGKKTYVVDENIKFK